jgi:PAS domain S-box-containing protein
VSDSDTGASLLGSTDVERLKRLRATLDDIDQGFQVIGFDWRYLYVNAAVARHARADRDQLLGRTMQACFPGIEHTPLFVALGRCMEERQPLSLENEFSYPDGSAAWFELRVQPCAEGIAVFSVDITERRRLEARLRQSEKLEAVGRLSSGIAHDFNNLLAVILGAAGTLLEALPPQSPLVTDATDLQHAALSAAELTRRLLAFSRPQPSEPRPLDVSALVAETEGLVRRLAGRAVSVVFDLAPRLPPVRVDPGFISQVLLNLVVNARDAMPQGGHLTLSTRVERVDPGDVMPARATAPGAVVVLSVRDTGEGMSEEVQRHLFEPFFTTKTAGRGTGLGLSIVYGIVKQLGGNLRVESSPGRGSLFEVSLPATTALAPAALAQLPATVLLVEGASAVRASAERWLLGAGYRVLRAADVCSAIACAREAVGVIDLIVVDAALPGVLGAAFVESLRDARPNLRVLFLADAFEVVQVRLAQPRAALVEKASTPETMLTAVRDVLQPGAA